MLLPLVCIVQFFLFFYFFKVFHISSIFSKHLSLKCKLNFKSLKNKNEQNPQKNIGKTDCLFSFPDIFFYTSFYLARTKKLSGNNHFVCHNLVINGEGVIINTSGQTVCTKINIVQATRLSRIYQGCYFVANCIKNFEVYKAFVL